MISTKHAKALLKILPKDGILYKKCVLIEDGKATASDSILLLQVPTEGVETRHTLTKESVERQVKLAKVDKREVIDVQECESAHVQYPPFQQAFPQKEEFTVCFSLKRLEQMIAALKAGATSKEPTVKLTFDSAHRPMRVDCEDMTALIAPTMES